MAGVYIRICGLLLLGKARNGTGIHGDFSARVENDGIPDLKNRDLGACEFLIELDSLGLARFNFLYLFDAEILTEGRELVH